MKQNNEFTLEEQLIIISVPTIKELLSYNKIGADALLLYNFYYYTAKQQKTNQPKATPHFCMKGLHWGKDRFRNADKLLRELNLIQKIPNKDEKGRITGWYVRINYIWTTKREEKLSPEGTVSRRVENPPCGKKTTNALSVNSLNALSVNNNKINGELEKSPPKKVKRKDFRVPLETYKRITDAYQKYKGIQLKGAEYGEIKRAIKTMLYSGRTEQDIIRFMEFCSEVCEAIDNGNEQAKNDFGWLRNWTFLTIKRKLPEFLAGKFD